MSVQNEDSLLDHISGAGWGIALVLLGLVVTIGDISLGAMAGIPMILIGIVLPIGLTYNAREESQRQEKRRRPERDSSGTFTLTSRKPRQD